MFHQGREKKERTADVEASLVATASATHSAEQLHMTDVRVDSVLGGLEDHPPCPHCLMGPCITVGELTHIQRSCAPDITNHTKRHKNYKLFWKSLKDRGLWQHEVYINRKTSAGLSEVELRELMPHLSPCHFCAPLLISFIALATPFVPGKRKFELMFCFIQLTPPLAKRWKLSFEPIGSN